MALQVIIGNMFSASNSFETRAVQWIRGLAALAALAVLMFAMPASRAAAAVPNGEGTYEDLASTFNDYWSWRTKLQAGVTQDFSPRRSPSVAPNRVDSISVSTASAWRVGHRRRRSIIWSFAPSSISMIFC